MQTLRSSWEIKPRLLLLNKADLVDKNELKQWVNYLKVTTGCPVIITDAKGAKRLTCCY